MTDTEERSTCVRENEILTDIYKCRICSTQVKRDRMDIEAHLKQAHKTTLKIYSANFENPNCTDDPKEIVAKLVRMGVLEEPSDKCRTPKKLKMRVSEIKYKSSSKKEIPVKLPVIETSKRKEPGMAKVIEPNPVPAVKNSDVPLINGNNVAISSPIKRIKIPKIKSEVTEVKAEHEFNGAYGFVRNELEREVLSESTDTENELNFNSKRKRKLPSKFTNDFEVTLNKSNTPQRPNYSNQPFSPKRQKLNSTPTASPLSQRTPSNTPVSESRSQNSTSKPPKLGSSLGGVTQIQRLGSVEKVEGPKSVGGMSSPGRFDHIKTEKSSPSSQSGDNVVYKCPLNGCTWTCGKEGMRQGPAVLHLLRVHKIQPLEMRERGIKFDKIYT